MTAQDALALNTWTEALFMAWNLERSRRLGELRGRHTSGFTGQGLHALSEEWGRVRGVEQVAPWLAAARSPDAGGLGCDPVTLRAHARHDAEQEFLAEARAGQEGLFS